MCPQLCDVHDAVCGAAAAFQKKLHSFSFYSDPLFDFLCYVMLATSSSLSLTPMTYLAGLL